MACEQIKYETARKTPKKTRAERWAEQKKAKPSGR